MTDTVLKKLNTFLLGKKDTFSLTVGQYSLENSDFDPDKTDVDTFLAANLIVGRPTLIGAYVNGGNYRWDCEYRVVVAVRKGTGSIEGSALARAVQDAFPRGMELLTSDGIKVKIEETYRQTGVPSGNFFHIPVSIRLWFYTPYQP